QELAALFLPSLSNDARNVVAFIAICFYVRCCPRLQHRCKLSFPPVKGLNIRVFLLASVDSGFDRLENMVQFPKEGCQVAAADDYIGLALIPDILLVKAQVIYVGLHRSRLKVDLYVCEMICRGTNS